MDFVIISIKLLKLGVEIVGGIKTELVPRNKKIVLISIKKETRLSD
ncbi:MAG: hypothetical protein Ta2E_12670 [Mycoplasmoidaceae bacterium]|nr:MAG: hypothetical protein Ta2E_12670 [Mycoplasmoidaceae bacterium]